jgi:hypothetical protein
MGAVTSTSRQRPNDHHGNAPARAIVLAILRRRVHEERFLVAWKAASSASSAQNSEQKHCPLADRQI